MTDRTPTIALSCSLLALLTACSGGSTTPASTDGARVAAADAADADTTPPAPVDSASGSVQPANAVTATPTAKPAEATLARIPTRFVGTWAPDTRACTADYDYQPAFQRIVVKPDQVGFFETAGDVQAVVEAGGSTRITLRERVGDRYPVYPIMISLADGGRALNYIREGERRVYVRCTG